jgi:hypothetical protein
MNVRCQISHTRCTDIDSSIDQNVTLFDVIRELFCNGELFKLPTKVIQSVYNFRLSSNLFIGDLLLGSKLV